MQWYNWRYGTVRLPRWISEKESTCYAADTGSSPWEDSSGEGNGNLLQYSYLGNPMDRGARRASLVGVFATTELQSWAQFRD